MNELELKQEIGAFEEKAKAIEITDEASFQAAGTFLLGLKALKEKIDTVFDPIIEAARKSHKAALAAKKEAETPVNAAESLIKPKIGVYLHNEQEKRVAAQKRAELEALKLVEEDKLRKAEVLEQSGKNREAMSLLEARIAPAPVAVAPAPKAQGVSMVKVWKYRIFDAGKLPREYLMPDEVKIGRVARALKEQTNIPGVDVYAENSIRAQV